MADKKILARTILGITSCMLSNLCMLRGQETLLDWSAFNSGSSFSSIHNLSVISSVGYPFVQTGAGGDSKIFGGFLADPLFASGGNPPYSGPVYSFQRWHGSGSVDKGTGVVQSPDSGYLACGILGDFNGRMYLVKLDQRGDTMWTKTIISEGQGASGAQSVALTSDGGYILTGWGSIPTTAITGLYLVRTNGAGDTLWTRWYLKGGASTGGNAVRQTIDGGFVVAGNVGGFNPSTTYILKTDGVGGVTWLKEFYDFGYEYPVSIEQLPDSGYIIGGWGQSPYTILMYAIRMNSDGSVKWRKTYNVGGAICCSRGNGIQYTTDNGFILVGSTSPTYSGNEKIYVVKADSSGDTLWTKVYGMTASDAATSVRQTSDGGYVLTGYSGNPVNVGEADVLLMKLDENGDSVWTRKFGGNANDFGNAVVQANDGGYIIVGQTYSFGNYVDVYIVKGDANGVVTDIAGGPGHPVPTEFALEQNYPNPFNPTTEVSFVISNSSFVTLKIYDVLGREVSTIVNETMAPGRYVRSWNANEKSSGVYFYRLSAGRFVDVKKMMFVK